MPLLIAIIPPLPTLEVDEMLAPARRILKTINVTAALQEEPFRNYNPATDHPQIERFLYKMSFLFPGTVDYIYFGDENRNFIGCQWLDVSGNGTGTKQLVFGARDSLTGHKYIKYAATSDGIRGADLKLPGYPQQYNPQMRPWYTAAAETGAMGWSSVYVYASTGDTGVTAYLPLYKASSTI